MDTSGRFDEAEQKFEQYISGKMWIAQARTSLDYTMLQEVINANGGKGDFFDESTKLAWQRQWWLSLSDPSRKEKLERYLQTPTGNTQLQGAWGSWRKTDFKTTFEDETPAAANNRRALHTLMWGNANAYPTRATTQQTPPDYTTLSNNVYHRNTEATQ